MFLTLFFITMLFGFASVNSSGSMNIHVSNNYYVKYQTVEINCTSTISVENNNIAIIINRQQVASIYFKESTGKCMRIIDLKHIECSEKCKCTTDGKSIAYVYNETTDNSTLELKCVSSSPFAEDAIVITKAIPVTTVTITPTTSDTNNRVTIPLDDTLTFTCSTDSSRPAAGIQWFIGNKNVSYQAVTQIISNGTRFISFSSLIYMGKDVNHNNELYCEAGNIEGRQKIKSKNIILDIQVPVKALTLTPVDVSNILTVASGEKLEFNCTTDSVRPAAWIQWYITGHNVTNDALQRQPLHDGTKFISSSKFVYTANEADQNKSVHCEAVNIEGRPKVRSTKRTLQIGHRPDQVIEVKTVCRDTIDVLWRSESDGGSTQMFQVVLNNLLSDIITRSDIVTDPGKGSIVHFTMRNLLPESYYTVKIESSNIYGTVQSDGLTYCNTSGTAFTAKKVKESTLSFSTGFGSGAALIVCINIITIIAILIWKKRRQTTKERSNVYEQTKHNVRNANMYNELGEISTAKQIPANTDDRTYEEINNEMRQSSSMNKRKQKVK